MYFSQSMAFMSKANICASKDAKRHQLMDNIHIHLIIHYQTKCSKNAKFGATTNELVKEYTSVTNELFN